jgi:ribosomal protein S8
MYLGTGKELKPFLNDKDKINNENKDTTDLEKENISDINKYFGNYTITKVTTTKNTSEDVIEAKEHFPGWIVEFSDKKIKVSISGIEWIIMNEPNFYVDNKDNVKSFFSNNTNTLNILVSGKDTFFNKTENFNFIINNNKLYLYRYNALFELKRLTENYKENDNFYNVALLDNNYTGVISNKINEINLKIKNSIEALNKTVIYVNSKIQEDVDLVHIYVRKEGGYLYSSSTTEIEAFTYNKVTSKLLNLEDYLKYKNKTLNDIKEQYDTKGEELLNEYSDGEFTPLSLTKDSIYYVYDGNLYIQYVNVPDGYKYVEIEL